MSQVSRSVLSFITLGALVLGCGSDPEVDEAILSLAAQSVPPVVPATEAEAKAAANRIVAIARGTGSLDAMNELWDIETMARRAAPGGIPPNERDAMATRVAEASGSENPLRRLRRAVAGGSISARMTRREGRPVARIRVMPRSGGVTFLDLYFETTESGPRVADSFDMVRCRWQSDTLTEMFVDSEPRPGETIDEVVERTVVDFTEHVIGRRYEEALAAYDRLPADRATAPDLLDLWFVAAQKTRDAEGQHKALERWLEFRGDSPAAPLKRFDLATTSGDWAQALEALASVERLFPDPFWLASEAWLELQLGHPERTLEISEQVIREDPALMQGPDWALLAALALERDADAVRFATILRDRFHLNLEMLATESGYERLATLEVPPPT